MEEQFDRPTKVVHLKQTGREAATHQALEPFAYQSGCTQVPNPLVVCTAKVSSLVRHKRVRVHPFELYRKYIRPMIPCLLLHHSHLLHMPREQQGRHLRPCSTSCRGYESKNFPFLAYSCPYCSRWIAISRIILQTFQLAEQGQMDTSSFTQSHARSIHSYLCPKV